MASRLEEGLRALDEAARLAQTIRIELDEDYLRAIALVEGLRENQSGADKSWVWRIVDQSARLFARAVAKR